MYNFNLFSPCLAPFFLAPYLVVSVSSLSSSLSLSVSLPLTNLRSCVVWPASNLAAHKHFSTVFQFHRSFISNIERIACCLLLAICKYKKRAREEERGEGSGERERREGERGGTERIDVTEHCCMRERMMMQNNKSRKNLAKNITHCGSGHVGWLILW